MIETFNKVLKYQFLHHRTIVLGLKKTVLKSTPIYNNINHNNFWMELQLVFINILMDLKAQNHDFFFKLTIPPETTIFKITSEITHHYD